MGSRPSKSAVSKGVPEYLTSSKRPYDKGNNTDSPNNNATQIKNKDTSLLETKGIEKSRIRNDVQKRERESTGATHLTDGEADERRDSLVVEFAQHISSLNSIKLTPGESLPPEILQALKGITDVYGGLKEASVKKQTEFKRDLGDRLISTGADRKICDIAVQLHKKGYRESDGDWFAYHYCIVNAMKFSDTTGLLTVTLVTHPEFLGHIRETLDRHCDDFLKAADITERTLHLITIIIEIAHNISIRDIDENIRRLREGNFTETLMPYLKSQYEHIVLSSIATLAEIVDEKESELLQADTRSIEFLVKRLHMALRSTDRRSLGWSCAEIARAIRRLARNDVNKKTLADVGAIPLLHELSMSEAGVQEDDIKEAVQAIWALSFDENNKLTVVNTDGLIDRLLELRLKSDKSIQHACFGALWTLRDTLTNTTKYCDIAKQLFASDEKSPSHDKPSSKSDHDTQGHIMISYQWDNQKTLIEISNRMKAAKFPVWMDVDDMGGSTLQAMAEAIENAHLVLICMSQKYKDSPNCRAEAEYAFQKRKIIIPLIMEKGYRPDGWLGLILGSKLFYDFSGKYPFESKVDGLIKEVEKDYRPPSVVDSADSGTVGLKTEAGQREMIQPERVPLTSAAHVQRASDEQIQKWTEEGVKKWARENSIRRVKLNEIAGEELLAIRNVQHKSPDFFYKILHEKLKLSSVRDLFRFESALNKL